MSKSEATEGKKSVIRREGFWYSRDEPQYPMPNPMPEDHVWEGRDEFLRKLSLVEIHRASIEAYKGSSRCRICDARNGSTEYEYGGWRWPSGFSHYIQEHNVRPSLAFEEFIVKRTIKGTNTSRYGN